jgi:hypothetical protein
VHWAQMVFTWWNTLAAAPGTLYHDVFVADLRMGLAGRADCWAGRVLDILARLGCNLRVLAVPVGADRAVALAVHVLPVQDLVTRMRVCLDEDWRSGRLDVQPREFPRAEVGAQRPPGPGVKMCRAKQWMGEAGYLSTYIPLKQRVSLTRFRLGCWPLAVSRPNGITERNERVCACQRGNEEDELHVLLECPF